jgi:hypothetical protein
MKTYRIYTRDRGKKYSALREIKAISENEALRRAALPPDWHAVAIEWPPSAISEKWLKKNV